jgi:hypothetical protein
LKPKRERYRKVRWGLDAKSNSRGEERETVFSEGEERA